MKFHAEGVCNASDDPSPSHFVARAWFQSDIDAADANTLCDQFTDRFEKERPRLMVETDITSGRMALKDITEYRTREEAQRRAEELTYAMERLQLPKLHLLEAIIKGKKPDAQAYIDFMDETRAYPYPATADQFLLELEHDKGQGAVIEFLKRNKDIGRRGIKFTRGEEKLLRSITVTEDETVIPRRKFIALAGAAAMAAARGGQNHYDMQRLEYEHLMLARQEADINIQYDTGNIYPSIDDRLSKLEAAKQSNEWRHVFKEKEGWVDAAAAGGAGVAAIGSLKDCMAPRSYTEAKMQLSNYCKNMFEDARCTRGMVRG